MKVITDVPVVEHKGPNDTDVSVYEGVADRLDRNEDIGGSNTRNAVAQLLRNVIAASPFTEKDVILRLDGHAAYSIWAGYSAPGDLARGDVQLIRLDSHQAALARPLGRRERVLIRALLEESMRSLDEMDQPGAPA